MSNDRLAKLASSVVVLVAVILAPERASAGGQRPQGKNGNGPSASYPASLPAVIVNPAGSACCYTVPIRAVYQCPAVLVDQPGSRVEYLRTEPRYGLLGGQPYLYHP